MKLYAYTKGNDYICSFDATLSDEKYENLFQRFKKSGLIETTHIRFNRTDEDGMMEGIEKLHLEVPAEIILSPDTIQGTKMPYPRRSGLGKVGMYHTYYTAQVAICKLPALYCLIFDKEDNLREDALKNIWDYLHNEWNDHIKEVHDNVSPEEDYLDTRISVEDKIELVKAFLNSLDITLDNAIASPLDNTEEVNQANYLRDITGLIGKTKEENHERKLK